MQCCQRRHDLGVMMRVPESCGGEYRASPDERMIVWEVSLVMQEILFMLMRDITQIMYTQSWGAAPIGMSNPNAVAVAGALTQARYVIFPTKACNYLPAPITLRSSSLRLGAVEAKRGVCLCTWAAEESYNIWLLARTSVTAGLVDVASSATSLALFFVKVRCTPPASNPTRVPYPRRLRLACGISCCQSLSALFWSPDIP